jgi:hypothetical protein
LKIIRTNNYVLVIDALSIAGPGNITGWEEEASVIVVKEASPAAKISDDLIRIVDALEDDSESVGMRPSVGVPNSLGSGNCRISTLAIDEAILLAIAVNVVADDLAIFVDPGRLGAKDAERIIESDIIVEKRHRMPPAVLDRYISECTTPVSGLAPTGLLLK